MKTTQLTLDSLYLNVADASSDVLKIVDGVTSYQVQGAWFASSFRNKTWDGRIHLTTYSRTHGYRVHAGCTADVVAALRNERVPFSFVDLRKPPEPSCDHGWTGVILTPQGIQVLNPREYQIDAARTVLTESFPLGRCMVKLPIRTGKTVLGGLIIGALNVPTLFVVTSDLLLEQTAKLYRSMFSTEIGVIGAGIWDVQDITVATIQSLYSKAGTPEYDQVMNRTDLAIFDECFVAGTIVDGKPIESLRVGDAVTAFDESTGELSQKKITRRFVSRARSLVAVTVSGRRLYCTPGHPFWTRNGWKAAVDLDLCDDVYITTDAKAQDGRREGLHGLRGSGRLRDGQAEVPVLLGRLQDREPPTDAVGAHDQAPRDHRPDRATSLPHVGAQSSPGPKGRSAHAQAHANEQPDEGHRDTREAEDDSARDGLEAASAGREWTRTDRSGAGHVARARMANERHCLDGQSSSSRSADALQAGCGERDLDGCRRDRRSVAPVVGTSEAGCAQGGVLAWHRVDRIEVLEPGSDGTFGGVCPDGLVYNLEVDGLHTYLVDGVVVHNCHHYKGSKKLVTSSKQSKGNWKDVVVKCPAYYKIGLSATIYIDIAKPTERENIWLKASTGNICYEVTTKRMIEEGWLLRPVIEMYHVRGPALQGDWASDEIYQRGIARYMRRNEKVVDLTVEAVAEGASVMVMARLHEHIDALYDALVEQGVTVEKLTGRVTGQPRHAVLRRFRKGQIKVLVGNVFGEGLDVPEVDVVIVAEGGESRKKTIQRMRNLTPNPGKKRVRVVDFLDEHEAHLARHAKARLEAYRKEDAFDIQIL